MTYLCLEWLYVCACVYVRTWLWVFIYEWLYMYDAQIAAKDQLWVAVCLVFWDSLTRIWGLWMD